MSTPRNSRWAQLLAVTCLATIGAPNREALGEQISVSWQTTDHRTAIDGDKVTREGTATFANGETAHIVMNIIHHPVPGGGGMDGSGTTVSVYRFDDGSAFTLRFVGIWNSIIARYTGIFGEGNGRFAGITGNATGGGASPGTGPVTADWTGTYELPKK
jgi:hypothetical protein